MKVEREAAGKLAAPRIVDDDHRGTLRGLNNRFHLAAVLRAANMTLGHQDVYRATIIVVATDKEGVLG